MDETTGETSWDAPIAAPELAMELGETVGADSLANWAGEDGGNENHGAVGRSGQDLALAMPPADEPQFAFFVNERGNRVFLVPRKAGS